MLKTLSCALVMILMGCDGTISTSDNVIVIDTSIDDTQDQGKKDPVNKPPPKDMGRTPKKDMGVEADLSGKKDSGVKDMGTKKDMGTEKDMDPPEEGEILTFKAELENCQPQTKPKPGCAPPPLKSTGDYHVDCVNRVNQFRAICQCLPPLKRWKDGEQCANQQAEYDSEKGQAHAGFQARICNGGNGQNECPSYRSEDHVIGTCLQQMWDEGPGEPFSAHGHYINMTSDRFSAVACGIYSGNNGTWAIQNFH